MKSQHMAGKTRLGWMQEFLVGERRFVEVSLDDYRAEQKRYVCRAADISGMKFTTSLATAVMSTPMGAITHLLCIERLE